MALTDVVLIWLAGSLVVYAGARLTMARNARL